MLPPKLLPFALLLAVAACAPQTFKGTPESDPDENLDENLDEISNAPRFLSFSFDADRNAAHIRKTVVGRITGDRIELLLSEGVDPGALVATFEPSEGEVFVGSNPQESGVTTNDFTNEVTYVIRPEEGEERVYVVQATVLDELRNAVPHFHIHTEDEAPIDSKETYRAGTLRIDGDGEYEDFEGPMGVRGRGNSTWALPKKPYRIKLDAKASILGLAAEKNWVLLANHVDGTLLGNAIAMKMGRQLQMPFTHHIIPVDVTVNGEYQGSYVLTEHKEVTKNRINIGDDGVLLELDTYFDEDYRFMSPEYELPVMIQHPELDKLSESEAQARFDEIQSDFESVEALIAAPTFPENGYRDQFDPTSFAKYLMVLYLSSNREFNWPKSVYLYRKAGEPYRMGPLWDFDWAFGYNGAPDHLPFVNPEFELFSDDTMKGSVFFRRLLEDPVVQGAFKTEWAAFKADHYPGLLAYTRHYAEVFKDSYARNHAKWEQGSADLDGEIARAMSWMDARVAYIDSIVDAM